jgi:hypothetical protein
MVIRQYWCWSRHFLPVRDAGKSVSRSFSPQYRCRFSTPEHDPRWPAIVNRSVIMKRIFPFPSGDCTRKIFRRRHMASSQPRTTARRAYFVCGATPTRPCEHEAEPMKRPPRARRPREGAPSATPVRYRPATPAMSRTERITRLFTAIGARDWNAASRIAEQLIQDEERNGHPVAARTLRGALAPSLESPEAVPDGSHLSIASALTRLPADVLLDDMVLPPDVRKDLEALVLEWKHQEQLKAAHIERRSRILFHGPPGCGKTLAAQALGSAFGLPVFVVRFEAVIGAYLGQTALRLRGLFRYAETFPCILLLDEIDALGKERGRPSEVGELDRVVIALMQQLEHSRPVGLVVATSNLPKFLDRALWRRFDSSILFPLPRPTSLTRFVTQLEARTGHKLSPSVKKRATQAGSFDAAQRQFENDRRRAFLAALVREAKNGV